MNEYQEILMHLSKELGLNVDSVGLLSIARGINNSMKRAGVSDTNEFFRQIRYNEAVFKDLTEEIKVPETWFFRDAECYNFMKNYIQGNLQKYSGTNPLRILSVPSSTGEEPYSAAMLAIDIGLNEKSVEIIAVDISSKSIEFAKKGVYRKSSFRNDYENFQEKFFTSDGTHCYLSEVIKKIPVFFEDNLVKPEFLASQGKFDFIFCKNLLIYLNEEARMQVLENISRLLGDEGVLLVGLSEINFFTRHGFEQIKHNMAFACKKSIQKDTPEFINYVPQQTKPLITKPFGNEVKKKIPVKKADTSSLNTQRETFTIDNVKLMADKGDFEGAEKICHTLLQHDYSNSEALYYMGLIQNALRNSDTAADYFKKVLYLNPDNYESLVHISLIYESSGDNDRALLYRERAERVYLKSINNSGAG